MAFDLERFYESEIFLLAKLSCRHRWLLEVRSSARNDIKSLKKEMKTAKRDRGYDRKEYRNQVVATVSSKIGKAKIRRKQLSNQIKKVLKLISTKEKVFNEVFPCTTKKAAESPLVANR